MDKIADGNFLYLFIVLPLMPVNWLLEAKKWQFLILQTHPLSIGKAFSSVLGGVAIGSMTPNRLGSFIGRLFWLPSDKRLEGTLHTFYSNWAQLIVTLLIGGFSLTYFLSKGYLSDYISLGSVISYFIILGLFILLYAFPSSIWKTLKGFFGSIKTQRLDQLLNWEQHHKGKVFLTSLIRYFVFLTQFVAVIYLFKIEISVFDAFIATSCTFLFTTFVPSLFFGKLIIREHVAYFCYSFFLPAAELPVVVIASLFIWIINIFIPAVSGTILLSQVKKTSAV